MFVSSFFRLALIASLIQSMLKCINVFILSFSPYVFNGYLEVYMHIQQICPYIMHKVIPQMHATKPRPHAQKFVCM